MSDLRHLHRLLNELQPAFLQITTSHGPPGSPVISVETYGKDHVVDAFPVITVTAANGDPLSLTMGGIPQDYSMTDPTDFPDNNGQGLLLPSNTSFTPADLPNMSFGQYASDTIAHAHTLAESLLTVTATDMVTGTQSSLSLNFIGEGPDPTLPNPFPASAQQMAVFEQYTSLINGDPPAPQSPPAAAPHHDPIHYIEGNMPIGIAEGEYGGAGGHHKG